MNSGTSRPSSPSVARGPGASGDASRSRRRAPDRLPGPPAPPAPPRPIIVTNVTAKAIDKRKAAALALNQKPPDYYAPIAHRWPRQELRALKNREALAAIMASEYQSQHAMVNQAATDFQRLIERRFPDIPFSEMERTPCNKFDYGHRKEEAIG